MTEPTSTDPTPASPPTTPSRQRGPAWMLVGLLVLLGAVYVINQYIANTGPTIDWIRNNLPEAQQVARDKGRRIFLMLYEPGCKDTERNDREVFTRRYARVRLANMVCCRIELKPDDRLRQQFKFHGSPLMLVTTADLDVLSRTEGAVTQGQFETYINPGKPGQAK